jgi:hypothetical protein
MKKYLIACILISCFLLVCCQTSNEKRSKFFNKYMKEHFPKYKITDGEYLLLLPGGCFNCNKTIMDMLFNMLTISPDSNFINSNYQAILISENTLNIFSDKVFILHQKVLCDSTNKLDRMSFGVAGIAVIKIKDKKIVASKSFTIKDYQTGKIEFFKERL